MPWFRKSQLDPLAVTMCGVKLGDRLLVLGSGDTPLIAALAGKAGLTGRACVLDASAAATKSAASAIEREGALVETSTAPWTMLPFDVHAFDVVVIRNVLGALDAEGRLRSVQEVHRVLRPGGRAVAIDDTERAGLAALFGSDRVDPQYRRSGGATHAMEAAGFRGVRTLAKREGQLFVEGVKAAS
jgi:ubiquinone/menaquinone biosynthesis C-methylase UbiE